MGGVRTEVGEYPWQVGLLWNGPELENQDCAGALVGDKYVVTSATCTNGYDASDYQVRVGDTSLDEEFEATAFTVDIASIKEHPNYDEATFRFDLAVLELTEPVSLTEYPNIKPICLPESGALFPGEAIMAGWG